MKKRGMLTAFISCKARPQDVKALATLARRRGQNKSQVVRALIREASQSGDHGRQDGDHQDSSN